MSDNEPTATSLPIEPKAGEATVVPASKAGTRRIPARKPPASATALLAATPIDPAGALRGWADEGFATAAAIAESGEIVVKDVEHLCLSMSRHVFRALEQSLALQSRMLGCRGLQEISALQSDWLLGQVDASVSEVARLAELSVTLPGRAAAPIRSRIEDAASG